LRQIANAAPFRAERLVSALEAFVQRPGARKAIASAWKVRRESYDGWDSLCMLVGALGLFAAFL
jgi:hypothetical protein